MALSTDVTLQIAGNLTSVLDHGTAQFVAALKHVFNLATGTGAGQADKMFSDNRSLGSGATDSLDLNGGGLLDGLGAALVFVKLKLLWIKSAAANTVDFTLFGDVNHVPILNTAATTTTLKPGSDFFVYNATGFTVTAGTGDIVKIVNGAATSVYDIVIIGTSV